MPKHDSARGKKTKREIREHTIYDSVAGRNPGTADGKLEEQHDKGVSFKDVVVSKVRAPDDVLLATGHEEVAEGVPVVDHKDLPDSELVKALHFYAAEYYNVRGARRMDRAFDETALLALGVMIEESIAEVAGPSVHKMHMQ